MGRGIPDRWAAYSAFGSIIRGTRFLPFKVPLKEALCKDLPAELKFTPGILVEMLREQQQQQQQQRQRQPMQLGLVIDLTNTKRYYNPQEITKHNILYEKIFTEGHEVPGAAVQRRFAEIVDRFLSENSGNGLLIGVHCTHGVNRTGYLVCRYMIDRMQALPSEAIQAFNDGRGHVIERENYLKHLSGVSTAVASKRDFDSAAGSQVRDAAILSAPLSQPDFYTNQPHSGSYELDQRNRAEASHQRQPRGSERKQAKREAKKLSKQSAGQGQERGLPPADRSGRLVPASRLTGADSPTWPRAVDLDGQRSTEGRYRSSQARPWHGSREDRACDERHDRAALEATERTARAALDGPAAGFAGAGTAAWDRLPDVPQVERPGWPYDVHDDGTRRRAFSDSRLFGSALPPHPATGLADGWQPWQQLPSRARSWQGDRCWDGRRWSPVRTTIPGYSPVTLPPQRDGSARVERLDPRQRWSRNGTGRY